MDFLRIKLVKLLIKLLDISSTNVQFSRKCEEVQWTNGHAKALDEFFQSTVGKDFLGKLEEIEFKTNAWAIGELQNGQARAYVARGIQHLLQEIHNMARHRTVVDPSFTDEEIDQVLTSRIGMHNFKPDDFSN